MTVNLLTRLEI